MAQKKRKRKSRHRGTAAGTVEARGRTSRPSDARKPASKKPANRKPANREEAREIARERRQARYDEPPTWRGALNRSLFAAGLFGLIMLIGFQRPLPAALALAALMVFLYLPMSYLTDRFLYNRRQRQKRAGGG